MSQDRPAAMPQIVPMLSYEDAAAAIEWLTRAFGFRERLRYTEPSGTLTHAELELGSGVVMLATPSSDYESARRHRESCEAMNTWLRSPFIFDGVYVSVDDVDAHFTRARAAGAVILSEPQDQSFGDRHYRCEDLEGHRWMFSQRIREVPAEEWGAVEAAPAQ